MRIPSQPYLQLELPIPMSDTPDTLDPDRHLQEDLLDTELPDQWTLVEMNNGSWAATNNREDVAPKFQDTKAYEDPEDASRAAHELHQEWLNDRATVGKAAGDGAPAGVPSDSDDESSSESNTGDLELASQPSDTAVEVLDEDRGEYVTVTPEMRAQAHHALHQVQGTILVTAYWIAQIYDLGLYAALGCNSKSQFVDRHLPFGVRQASKYAKIGRKLGRFLPFSDQANADQLPSADDVNADDLPDSVQSLPMGKLSELTKLDDDDLKDYVETGQWTGPDGQTYTRDDVLDMARTELGDIVSERTKRLRDTVEKEKDKRQQAEERAEKAEEEKAALEEKLEEEEARIETAQDLERRLGPTASKLQEKRETLEEVKRHLDEALRLLPKVGITDEDPEPDQENIQRLQQRIQRLEDVLHEDYGEVLINLGL